MHLGDEPDRTDEDAGQADGERGLRTAGGVELTDEYVQQLADEAEAGYDVERLQPRPRRQ